jgi:hypothetical protein
MDKKLLQKPILVGVDLAGNHMPQMNVEFSVALLPCKASRTAPAAPSPNKEQTRRQTKLLWLQI